MKIKACYRIRRMPCSVAICSTAEVVQFRRYLLCACYMPGAVLASKDQSVQSLSHVRLFVTPWTAARQASQSLLKLMSIELVMPSNHLVLYCPLLLLPSIFLSIRVFSNETVLPIRWPK